MKNQVQLIAYADRFGGSVAGLREVLDAEFAGVFGGVHLLPFFTPFDGADAGFDPVDHTQVDPRLGAWDDVAAIGTERDTVVDVIVNHVSADSAQFRDWLARGDASMWADMFLTLSAVFPDGATEADLARIYRPRPGLPFTPVTVAGRRRLVWTTFTPQQVDVDVSSDSAQAYLGAVLDALASARVSIVRLDAVGYAVKTPGTSCFMTPETFAFIDDLTARARSLGMAVLVEVHSYYERQVEIGRRVDRVYDFALPPLILHALTAGDCGPLAAWMAVRPTNAVTVLDTHDGIGVVDVGADPDDPTRPGLLTPEQVDALVEGIHVRTGGQSRAATGAAASNLDVYQVNSTYYAALGSDDLRYLIARAIQFFVPGIPQVYYVGALVGGNDTEMLQATGVGRDINRHNYSRDEIARDLVRPVVRALNGLARFRNTHPAFDGELTFAATEPGCTFTWRAGVAWAALEVDARAGTAALSWTDGEHVRTSRDLLADPPGAVSGP
jgi:sucrose phosphorylase